MDNKTKRTQGRTKNNRVNKGSSTGTKRGSTAKRKTTRNKKRTNRVDKKDNRVELLTPPRLRVLIYIVILIITTGLSLMNYRNGYGGIDAVVTSNTDATGLKITLTSAILAGLANGFNLISIMQLINKPICSILTLILSEWCFIFSDMSRGYSFKVAFDNTGVIEVFGWGILIGIMIHTFKNMKQGRSIKNFICMEKLPYKVPLWATASIMFISISIIFYTANDLTTVNKNDGTLLKIYVGLAALLPTFTTLTRYLVSDLAYKFLAITTIFGLATLYKLGVQDELMFTSTVYFMLQTSVIIFSIIEYKIAKGKLKCKRKSN
jgi:hypothetical protein